MKKKQTIFVCSECGSESPKWSGQCICGAWNTMYEEHLDLKAKGDARSRGMDGRSAKPIPINEVKADPRGRMDTGIGELNRVLGGGLVRGSLVLISGEPGIGKSTLIIEAAGKISASGKKVLYVTGEESEEQIKLRSDRVCTGGLGNLYLLAETNMENIASVVTELKPDFVIIDSIQTMYSEEAESAPGSVSQVRICGNHLMKLGKGQDIPVFIVAHVTKNGELAGPKIVEHLVDCVLSFSGERSQELRILRSMKNRFGTTSEIGAFEMKEEGLVPIENLSGTFLEGMEESAEGAVATAVYEGSRPLLLEVQALTAKAYVGFPRRSALGAPLSRLNMILAVLERKAGVSFANEDVYVNIVGGLKPEGTSFDLAVAMALYSSLKGVKFPEKTLAIGEIGLTGDLRSVQQAEKIVKEAARMGFLRVIMPEKNATKLRDVPKNIQIIGIKTVTEAFRR